MPPRHETFAVRTFCHPLSREVIISGSARLETQNPPEAAFRIKCNRGHLCPLVFIERLEAMPPCQRTQ
ncbi:MAG: hypothetical protein H6Q00_3318 [Holophagaceae bacterium]|nr:hypothetical protein [Holophagaceae bacterium]